MATDLTDAGRKREEDFVRTMDSVDHYLELRQQLTESLKKAFFSLAQAKYSMGPIGQSQYNMEMQATCTVHTDSSGEMVLCHTSTKAAATGVSTSTTKEGDESRTRVLTGGGCTAEAGGDLEGRRQTDPINWFGVLVPQTLRSAQTGFKEALELSVKLANISRGMPTREGGSSQEVAEEVASDDGSNS